nr:ribonuclease H-like domain-containing protein [Tanacetum cinerariifolium]
MEVLVHTLLHCLSTKSRSWDQFGSPIAIALICLSDGRRFNWSNYIFRGMVSNIGNAKKFLMYPRFHQTILGGGVEVAEQAVPYPMPTPDQSLPHLPTPSRQQTSDPLAPVLEHDHSSDLHETAAGFFPTREDAPLGGNFHTSPLRSSHAPPVGQPSRAELHDHKKLFKNVVGNDIQDVDLDALRALANVAVDADSDIPSGSTSQIPVASLSVPTAGSPGTSCVPPVTSAIPPGAFDALTGASPGLPGTSVVPATASAVPTDSPNVLAAVPADSLNVPTGVPSKGKSSMVEEDIPVKARTFRQLEEDRLGEEAAKRAQVEANASLSKTLLGNDVFEDNFSARMAVLIKRKRQALTEQLFKEWHNRPMTPAQQKAYMRQYVKNHSSAIYNTGWTMAYVKSFTDEQLKQEFEKIRKVPISPAVSSPPSSRTRRKSLGRKQVCKPKSTLLKLDLHVDAQTFLKVVVTDGFDDEDSDDEVWSAVVGWEVLPTPLGVINALYRIDGSTKHFDTLCQILHMVDRQDLMKLYGLVVQYYEHDPIAGAGLLFLGDLQVLFNSQAGGKGFFVWQNQHLWKIRSWRLYTLSNVHVLEMVSGEVLSMFMDVSYPLSVALIEKMLMHMLEIDSDFVGNDLTIAEQLVQFIKN